MYLVGKITNDSRFDQIYAIFKNEKDVNSYLKDRKEGLVFMKFVHLNFPFFIIEERQEQGHFYFPISKMNLEKRIETIERSKDVNTIYFNLWRIGGDHFNARFPNEACLNGRDWHSHFTHHDLEEIENVGFEKYWNDLLIA